MAAGRITWPQALAWRMQRQLLAPLGALDAPGVVQRMCGIQAQVASSAELAIRLRQRTPASGEVARDLAAGRLVKTWAMRGALHLLAPQEAGRFLSLLAAARTWERPVWQRHFGATSADMDHLRDSIGDVLGDAALTREQLIAEITRMPRLKHMGPALRSGWGTLLKPLAWQGAIVFGPNRGRNVTFMRPQVASTEWAGVPDPEEAAPSVIAAYLSVFGPASIDRFDNWLAGGGYGRRRLTTWFESLGGRLARVAVEGDETFLLAEHVDELAATRPTREVRLLGGFDQYVLGPGTADGHVTPVARRRSVSLQSGWISPVVISGGPVSGTWQLDDDTVAINWFEEAGRPPRAALERQVGRVAEVLGRRLEASVSVVD